MTTTTTPPTGNVVETVLELYVTKGRRHSWRLFDANNGEKLARGSHGAGWVSAQGAWRNAKGVVLRLSGFPLPPELPKIGEETMDTWTQRDEGVACKYALIIRRAGDLPVHLGPWEEQ